MIIADTIQEIDATIKVANAYNGVEALSFLKEAKQREDLPCLVILDINMPMMDGKQALSLIKKDEALEGVPVVMFTTSSSPMDKAFATHHGVRFVTKPLDPKELYHTVQDMLSYCS